MNSTQIENCRKFYAIAQSKLAGDTSGHSLDHILRVVNNAVLITRSEAPCDLYLIVAAALLHDVIDDKLTAELSRLEALKAVNPNIRDDELAAIESNRQQVLEALGQAGWRLDALRLIVVTHQ